MKKIIVWITTLIFLAGGISAGLAQSPDQDGPVTVHVEDLPEKADGGAEASGEGILLDVLVLRPMGFAACTIGIVGTVVAFPFAALTGSQDRVTEKLIREPCGHTFKRPLGETGR
jgi:hypothetical protein